MLTWIVQARRVAVSLAFVDDIR